MSDSVDSVSLGKNRMLSFSRFRTKKRKAFALWSLFMKINDFSRRNKQQQKERKRRKICVSFNARSLMLQWFIILCTHTYLPFRLLLLLLFSVVLIAPEYVVFWSILSWKCEQLSEKEGNLWIGSFTVTSSTAKHLASLLTHVFMLFRLTDWKLGMQQWGAN